MNKLQFVSCVLAMVAGVVAYRVISINALKKSEHTRTKRDFVNDGKCAGGFKYFFFECTSLASYNDSKDDYEFETESKDEYVTTQSQSSQNHNVEPLQSGSTAEHSTPTTRLETTPHSGPMSGPNGTPHPQTTENYNVEPLQPGPTAEHSTPMTRATTTAHSGPMSSPDGTPHSQLSQNDNVMSSQPGQTLEYTTTTRAGALAFPHYRNTPRSRSTSQSSSTPSPTTSLGPAPVSVSGAKTTSTPYIMTATILFALSLCWVNRAV